MFNSCNLSRGSMSLLFWFLQLVFVAGSKLPTLHSSSLASLKLTDISLKIGLPYKDNWSSHHHFSLATSGKPLPRHRWCSINYWIGVRRCTGQIWQKYRIVFGRLVSLVGVTCSPFLVGGGEARWVFFCGATNWTCNKGVEKCYEMLSSSNSLRKSDNDRWKKLTKKWRNPQGLWNTDAFPEV